PPTDPRAVGRPWFRGRRGNPDPAAYAAARQQPGVFRCPAADVPADLDFRGTVLGFHFYHTTRQGLRAYVFETPLEEYQGDTPPPRLGTTDYTGVGGAGFGNVRKWTGYDGAFTNRSAWSVAQIAGLDGTSNVLLYGETCGHV